MSGAITKDEVTFDHVLSLAQRLQPTDQARLVARLAPKVEWVINHAELGDSSQARKSLRGLLADLGQAPSAEDIDEIQHEMWGQFAQE